MTTFRQVQKQFTTVFAELVDGGVGKLCFSGILALLWEIVLRRGDSLLKEDEDSEESSDGESYRVLLRRAPLRMMTAAAMKTMMELLLRRG